MSNQSYASAVRSATFVGDDNRKVPGSRGCKVTLNLTAVPGTDTVQPIIEGKDRVSGAYYPILTGAAQVATGVYVLTVLPGAAVTANVSASDALPDTYRVRVVHSAGSNFTYSLSVDELT